MHCTTPAPAPRGSSYPAPAVVARPGSAGRASYRCSLRSSPGHKLKGVAKGPQRVLELALPCELRSVRSSITRYNGHSYRITAPNKRYRTAQALNAIGTDTKGLLLLTNKGMLFSCTTSKSDLGLSWLHATCGTKQLIGSPPDSLESLGAISVL